jgi:sentrin-specific protease 7
MSKIERKAIVQDFEANAPNQAITSATTTTSTENEKKTTQKSALSTGPTATAERLAPPNEEDPNLFDEAALSFVDRDDAGTGVPPESGTTQAESGRQNQQTECLAVTDTTDAQPETSSQSQFATSSTKKKAKRRPVPKRDPDQPVIIVLDSLGGNARTGAVRALKDWIAAEGFNRRGMEAVIKENGYYPKSSQVPMQNNFTDCGVYLLGYIEKFFQNPDDFKDKLLTGSMSAQEDWPELDPSEMRHKMRQIIFDCYKKQEDDRRAQRKAKKISASSKTSPTATPHKPTNLGRRDSEGSQNGRPKLKSPSHKDGAQPASPQTHSPARPPARLGSPFSFDAEHAPSAKQSPQAAVSKVSDSPPVLASPVKQAISTPQPEATPRRHSPNIRNSSRTPQSDGPLRNGKITLNQTPRSIQANQQTSHIPSTSSPKKRRRQGDGSDEVKSPTAKRQFTGSPQRNQNSNAESKKSASRSREGSVPNAPIEINDSQEVQVIDVDHRQQAQPSSFAQRKPPSRHPHPREGLRPSPTFEGNTHSSSSFKTSKHGQHEGTPVDGALRTKLDEDDHARDNVQRSRAPNPSEGIGALESREEILDPVAGISQSTHDLQLDGVNDGSVVEETPEPEETSTAVQTGWSRDNPLLL